jgi:hypothetical protein
LQRGECTDGGRQPQHQRERPLVEQERGEGSEKPIRLRASRSFAVSEGLIASIAASNAQPVSLPNRMPETLKTAPTTSSVNSSRSIAGSGLRHANAVVIAPAAAMGHDSVAGNCRSKGTTHATAASNAQ